MPEFRPREYQGRPVQAHGGHCRRFYPVTEFVQWKASLDSTWVTAVWITLNRCKTQRKPESGLVSCPNIDYPADS